MFEFVLDIICCIFESQSVDPLGKFNGTEFCIHSITTVTEF